MAQKSARLSFAQTWPFATLLIIALYAFFTTTAQLVPLACAGIIAAAELVRVRMPHSRLLAAALRLTIFTPIVIHLGIPPETFPQWYLKPSYTTLIGCILSAEAAIRAWEPPGGLLSGDQRGVMFFVSALLMAGACNTNEHTPVNWLAPCYIVMVIVALRSFDNRRWRISFLQFVRAGMIAVVLLGGFRLALAITQYDELLNSFVERLFFQRQHKYQIGLSSSPRLGGVFNPLQTMDRVLLVEGSRSERYLAAAEFDHYQTNSWLPDLTSRPFSSVDPRELRTNQRGTKLTFMRIGGEINMLALPLNSVSVESVAGVERDEFGALRHTEQGLTGGSSLYYATVPSDDGAQGPLTAPLLEAQRRPALQLVDGFDPRAIELSRRLTSGRHDESAVSALVNHLRATHGYSLEYLPMGGEAISTFILQNKPAHCMYFASALVMLCRASGIPARLVTGYYAYEPFSGDTLVVRGRDAHAWAECWIEGKGWLTFDATPAGGRPDLLNTRSSLIRRLGERISDWPGYFRDWVSQFSEDAIIVVVCSAAGILFLGFVLRVIWLRRLARLRAAANEYRSVDRRLMRAARQFERLLALSGERCSPTQTWRDCLPQLPEAEAFVNAYEQARYGGADESDVQNALEALQKLRLQQVSRRRSSAITSPSQELPLGR